MASWLQAATAASISAASFVQEASSRVQQSIEQEAQEFLQEYSSFTSAAPAPPAAAPPAVAEVREDGLLSAPLEEIRRVGTVLFNPFEDQARRTTTRVPFRQLSYARQVHGLTCPT